MKVDFKDITRGKRKAHSSPNTRGAWLLSSGKHNPLRFLYLLLIVFVEPPLA